MFVLEGGLEFKFLFCLGKNVFGVFWFPDWEAAVMVGLSTVSVYGADSRQVPS